MNEAELEARLDRIESTQALQMLPSRYALAVDSRDLDGLVSLFVEDVDAGRWGRGREALKGFYEKVLTDFYRSQHQIVGHAFDFDDSNRAHGTVYCRAEHEQGDHWVLMIMVYFDQYERRGGRWCFARRRPAYYYANDIDERPGAPLVRWPERQMNPAFFEGPHAFAGWTEFWAKQDPELVARLTRQPGKPQSSAT